VGQKNPVIIFSFGCLANCQAAGPREQDSQSTLRKGSDDRFTKLPNASWNAQAYLRKQIYF